MAAAAAGARRVPAPTGTGSRVLSVAGVEGAGGKCQTWKLPLNDCRLFGVLSAAVEGKRTSASGVDEAPRRERRIDRARWRNGEKWNPVSV